MKLNQLYRDILSQQKKWNYYISQASYTKKDYDKLFKEKEISNIYSDFIRKYINKSGKESVLLFEEGLHFLINSDHKRCKHIVSTFFLGLEIMEKIDIKSSVITSLKSIYDYALEKYLNMKDRKYKKQESTQSNFSNADVASIINKLKFDENREHIYLWFMLCLFHDLGYLFESEETSDKTGIITENDKIDEDIDVLSLNDLGIVPPCFDSRTIKEYYKFRKKDLNKEANSSKNSNAKQKLDHGIAGAVSFFKGLCNLRKFNDDKPKDQKKNYSLYWGAEMDTVYQAFSNVIMCHNIWFERVDNPCNNNKLELSNEIVSDNGKERFKYYPIHYTKYPIFFFFCLIDAIEPFKKLNAIDHISIDFKDKSIIITIDMSEGEKEDNYSYIDGVSSLNSYLCPVYTTFDNNRKLVTMEIIYDFEDLNN